MVGTLVNTGCIIAGSVIGSVLKRGIRPKYQDSLYVAMGICSLALGVNACVRNIPNSVYPVLFIVSIALGSLIGAGLNLSERFNRLVNKKSSDGRLGEGLTTGILLFCIGTFSILGPMQSALQGDNTYLYTNATLDFITSAVLASTYGIGMIWAAPVLFCWQGMFYLIAKISESAINTDLMTELQIIGGALIMASGLSILKIKDCKTLNMIPSLLMPVLFFLFIHVIQ
jgi:uncharacterized membrane protein YqgA involved in biofilm formation